MGLPIKITKTLFELNRIELWWIITHPFRAFGVWKISETAREIANQRISDPDLDGDYAGGQIDAFRHILWMALLTQKYNANFARKVGLMHERANKLDFKLGKVEEHQLPDSASMIMDLMNNEIGLEIGQRYPDISLESLIQVVKRTVLEGKAWVIYKDEEGNFLDQSGQVIPTQQWIGKWNTPKLICPSDTLNPKNGRNHRAKKRSMIMN